MTNISMCLRSFMSAVSNGDNERILRHLALDSELSRFYQIFGCDSLRLMLNRIPGGNVQISQVTQNGCAAQVLVSTPDKQRWSTVWLRKSEGSWQITEAYPLKLGDESDLGYLSEEVMGLLQGTLPLGVECRDDDLTRFLRDVYRQARIYLHSRASDYRGKVTSIFEITDYLWIRKAFWSALQKMGYDTTVYRTTKNNDIYAGIKKRTSQRVAVKLLRNPKPHMRERFLNEIRVLDSLRHLSSVPTILFSATVEGIPYFASEWALGDLLEDEILKSPGWSIGKRVQIIINVARAIHDLRIHNVIHRDLATDNVFVRQNLEVSLVDFGMASFIHDMEPEKFRVAHRKEIRNLGLLACYLLVEKPQPLFGSASQCIDAWAGALAQLRASDLSTELIGTVERAVAADSETHSITFNHKPAYEEIEELLLDFEHASNHL